VSLKLSDKGKIFPYMPWRQRGKKRSTSCSDHFTMGKKPGTHWCEGWVGPRVGLDVSGDDKICDYNSKSGLCSP